MDKPNIADILKELMFERNLTPTSLSRKLGLPQQTIQKIVARKSLKPQAKTLKLIADFFDISIPELKGDIPRTSNKTGSIKNILTKEIHVYTWDQIGSLGDSALNIEKTISVAKQYDVDVFGLVMNDTSMELQFPKGSILILDPNKEPFDRSFILVHLEKANLYVFRQLIVNGDKKFLKPLNIDLATQGMRVMENCDETIATLVESRQIY